MRDPYDVLGIARTASAKDIKSAYRKLAKKHHPDQNQEDAKAQDRFAALNQAYEILGDDERRAAFDRGEIDAEGKPRFQGFQNAGGGDPYAGFRRSGDAGQGGQRFEFRTGGPGGADIFSEIFGQAFSRGQAGGPSAGRAPPPAGADMNASLDISLEDAAGAGKVAAVFPDGRKISVKLPVYVEDGQTIRLKGQGEASPFGGEPGDALVKLRIRPHPRYRVEGRNLHADLPVDLRDAVLGAKLPVETPGGRVAVTVPPWSSSDKVLRIKGRGLPLKAGGHGDLHVYVRVMLPARGDPELEALMRKREG